MGSSITPNEGGLFVVSKGFDPAGTVGSEGDSDPVLGAYTQLMLSIRQFLEKLIQYAGDALAQAKEGHRLVLSDTFAKEMEVWRKQIEASSKSLFEKVFMAIAQALAAVFALVMAVVAAPIAPIISAVLAMCAMWMLLQMSGGIQELASDGKNFMTDMMTAICGGNESLAGWMTMGMDIFTGLLALGACLLLPPAGAAAAGSVSGKIAALCSKVGNTFKEAAVMASKSGSAALARLYQALSKAFTTAPVTDPKFLDRMRKVLSQAMRLFDNMVTAAKSGSGTALNAAVGKMSAFVRNLAESLLPDMFGQQNKTRVYMTIATLMGAVSNAFSMVTDIINLETADLKLDVEMFKAKAQLMSVQIDLMTQRIEELMGDVSTLDKLFDQGITL